MTRNIYLIALIVALAASALALPNELGTSDMRVKASKPIHVGIPTPPVEVRQGGDTVMNATPLTLPVYDLAGSTAGYSDDYDEICPYSGSTAPDVVYTFTPSSDVAVDIDMLGSQYDTKIYVYDAELGLIGCNDDFHPDYTSKLENLSLMGDRQYYLVIDGYGEHSGDYVLSIIEFEPCVIDLPSGWAQYELEPTLHDGYIDEYNGGCNSSAPPPFERIDSNCFLGRSGWYFGANGTGVRDTDWFLITIPSSGVLEITGDAEYECYMFELGPHDCEDVAVIQNVIVGPCSERTMTITGPAGSNVWFWFGPTTYDAPNGFIGHEFYYILNTSIEGSAASESRSLTSVKGLFK